MLNSSVLMWVIRKSEFGAGEGEGKSSNGKTTLYILRAGHGGEEKAETEHMVLQNFIPLPVNGESGGCKS